MQRTARRFSNNEAELGAEDAPDQGQFHVESNFF
jgi:hypothetical protein